MPELTVAMPAYNTGRYIGEAIESVLRQEGVDFELVVVDDGSADDTVRVVRGFPSPRIRLIENGARRGIAHCHNVVLERSTAPFLAHVDSDDLILPGALRKLVAAVRSAPRVGQAYCHTAPWTRTARSRTRRSGATARFCSRSAGLGSIIAGGFSCTAWS